MQKKIPVVIDCDPGVDDAYALLMTLTSPQLEVRAITTVAGNMPLTMTTNNALRIVELAGKNVSVSAGCAEALCRSSIPHSEMFHGANGLGNATIPEPTSTCTTEIAVETLRRLIEQANGDLHIIALGPLTNIALLFKLYPHLKGQIAHLTIMGGSRNRGNITDHAEFNFYCDAESAKIVMSSGVPITLVDLDGCEDAPLTAAESIELTNIPSRVSGLLREMWDFNLTLATRFGDAGFVIHDAIAVAAVIDPQLIATEPCDVSIHTDNDDLYGKCVVTNNPNSTTYLTVRTDKARFVALCRTVMDSYPL